MSDGVSFYREAQDSGRQNWDIQEHPDWLLFEIENNLVIRSRQIQVATEMISPYSRQNSVSQLNMGEGKSSGIIPLSALSLADGGQLSTVVVLKPLGKQMMDVLSRRLRGLTRRPLYFLPFSRNTALAESSLDLLVSLWKECARCGSILLAFPEHILSFNLIGLDRLAHDKSFGHRLMKAYKWLQSTGRHILDESDEILNVKYQLIYTVGIQQHMDGQPQRWTLIQTGFDLVEEYAKGCKEIREPSVELEARTEGSFPFLRFVTGEAWDALLLFLTDEVLEGRLPGLSFENCSLRAKALAGRFIRV